ncbi:baculoviral IAP repeat-containing protein 7-like isoform X2 [Haliotis rufescens]|uniref:baculoviral IAP repeat-containing protein 7-like isoform X2 n=1 Tax=Haliotis rufescens TaxID=6454 RepID=UPI00201EFA3A|nr:baculoviral IAP repeat-containing protein 7-like isoform X2 [Haliotis rufescens]
MAGTDTTVTLTDSWTACAWSGISREGDFSRRLGTYAAWTGRKDRDTLAKAGFIYTGIGDKVECERCGLKLLNWTDTDDALHEHATRRTHCPFIVSLYRKLGQTPPPKHPQYQHLRARLDSFVDWPRRYVPKTPEELAAAGFFYIGSADRVTCFQCGITLRDWEEEHDPVVEHQRYSEHCQFINKTDLNQLGVATRTVEGEKTEQSEGSLTNDAGRQNPCEPSGACQEATGATNHIQDTTSTGASNQRRVPEKANNLTSQTTEKSVTLPLLWAATTPSTQADRTYTSGDNVPSSKQGARKKNTPSTLTTLTSSDTKLATTSSTSRTDPPMRPSSRRLAEENKLLKQRRTCRVCEKEIVSELFLPCGHLVTCSACAPKVNECIVCKKTILGTVTVFIT